MSTPLLGQPSAIQPPPPYSSHSGKGSVGPVIGVLAVIVFFGVVAVIFGRLCSGRTFIGDRRFDLEGWVERKCAACIDGRIENSGAVPGGGGGTTAFVSGGGPTVVEATPESKRTSAPHSQNSASSV